MFVFSPGFFPVFLHIKLDILEINDRVYVGIADIASLGLYYLRDLLLSTDHAGK